MRTGARWLTLAVARSAVLSRHAVDNSVRPSAYTLRAIHDPVLRSRVSLATSSNLLPPFEAQARIVRVLEEEDGLLLALEFLSLT